MIDGTRQETLMPRINPGNESESLADQDPGLAEAGSVVNRNNSTRDVEKVAIKNICMCDGRSL